MARPFWPLAAKAAAAIGVVKESWNGFNILHTAAGRVGALDVCALLPGEGGKTTRGILAAAKKGDLDVLFLGGADEIDTNELGYNLRRLSWEPMAMPAPTAPM